MAAQNPGTFENWITDRIIFGNTRGLVLVGRFENWITDRKYFDTYPDAVHVITPTGIATAEAFGNPAVSVVIDAGGVPTGEGFGLPLVWVVGAAPVESTAPRSRLVLLEEDEDDIIIVFAHLNMV